MIGLGQQSGKARQQRRFLLGGQRAAGPGAARRRSRIVIAPRCLQGEGKTQLSRRTGRRKAGEIIDGVSRDDAVGGQRILGLAFQFILVRPVGVGHQPPCHPVERRARIGPQRLPFGQRLRCAHRRHRHRLRSWSPALCHAHCRCERQSDQRDARGGGGKERADRGECEDHACHNGGAILIWR